MKAISLHQPWASWIAQGRKTIETRTWPTRYRGDLLIVSTKKPKFHGYPLGQALCIVSVVGCREMTVSDEKECGFPEANIVGYIADYVAIAGKDNREHPKRISLVAYAVQTLGAFFFCRDVDYGQTSA